jgi:hypothetical protein
MNFSVVPLGQDPYIRRTDHLAKEGAKVIACSSQDQEHPADLAIDGAGHVLAHRMEAKARTATPYSDD